MAMSNMDNDNGRSPLLFVGGLILLGLAAGLLLFGGDLFGGGSDTSVLEQVPLLSAPDSSSRRGDPLTVGDTAVDFTLADLEGSAVSLSDFRGQPVIINFWATWCAPCRIEMPELQAVYDAYRDDGLVILALDQDESPEQVRAFFYDEMDLTFTPLLDDGAQISALYGAINFPTTYFVNGEGEITAVHRGLMNEEIIIGYLADILPGLGQDS